VSKLTDPTMQQQKNNFYSKWRLDLCLRRIIGAKYRLGSFLAPRHAAYSVGLFNVRTVDESY